MNWLRRALAPVGRFLIRQINRLPEPRLNRYQEPIDVWDATAPLYLILMPVCGWLDWHTDGLKWTQVSWVAYFGLALWWCLHSARLRAVRKTAIQATLDFQNLEMLNQPFSHYLSQVIDASRRDAGPDKRLDYDAIIKAALTIFYQEFNLTLVNVNVIATAYDDAQGQQQIEAYVHFTLWFDTDGDAVSFKLLNSDAFDYA